MWHNWGRKAPPGGFEVLAVRHRRQFLVIPQASVSARQDITFTDRDDHAHVGV